MTLPAPDGYFFVCVVGPDQGKRLALSASDMLIGKGVHANVHSDDPYVCERFATLRFDGVQVHLSGLAEPLPFVDGHSVQQTVLTGGQQVRLGSSIWEVHAPGGELSVMALFHRLGGQLSQVAGIENSVSGRWDAREIFGDVAKKHGDEDIEDFFTVGTAATTPSLITISTRWPKPWVFARVFAFTAALYLFFVFAWQSFENENLIPGLLMVGTVAVPLSLLIFFFEMNVPRNISLYQVIKLLLVGGLVSIVVSLVFFKVTNLTNWLGAASAGIIEESGKALTLLLVVGKPRYRWALNGLLFGATVGTGFAIFESAGYALSAAVGDGGSISAMRDMIMLRGFLSVFGGHVLWTGLVGAALWRVRGDQPFDTRMLIDPRFLRVVVLCMAMHMVWNSPLPSTHYLKYIALGVPAWLLVFATIQNGLKQVRMIQAAAATNAAAPPAQ